MFTTFISRWTKSPIAFRNDKFILVWFGVIVGAVVALAVPTILILSYRLGEPLYVKFFFSFFTWWPVFSILGAILLFHDFWFRLGRSVKKIVKGEKVTWRRPGAVFYGGFTGSLLLMLLLGYRLNLSALRALDFIFIIIPFYHGISRLACLNFGCCYGKKCTHSAILKVSYVHPESEPVKHGIPKGQYLHAVQLYEMICCIAIGILLVSLIGRLGEGRIFAVYLICYGIVRFLLEFVRDNTYEKMLSFRISIWQLLSLLFAVAGLILYLLLPDKNPIRLISSPANPDYTGIIILSLWNALSVGLTFGIHFRKRDESL